MATAGSGWHAYLSFSESFSARMEKSRQYKFAAQQTTVKQLFTWKLPSNVFSRWRGLTELQSNLS